ncbi:hypothetical protein, partial [Staphylococcus epidermidis]|uniref:hypothetical protein n=1 Tax=Staphylococcus epidermidis TaxID=1282 RepID=UPI0039E18F34
MIQNTPKGKKQFKRPRVAQTPRNQAMGPKDAIFYSKPRSKLGMIKVQTLYLQWTRNVTQTLDLQ